MHRIRTATYFASPVSYSSPDHHPGLAGLPTPVARSTPTPKSVDQASEFTEVAAWSNEGGSVTFSGPNAIAIDSQDNVYLTEFGGDRVQKFTPDGVFLAQWGGRGADPGSSDARPG